MCTAEAPEIFTLRERLEDHDQVEILLEEVPNLLRAKLDAAVRYCPNRVLSIEELPDASPTAQRTTESP
jgi:ferredoxin